MIIYKTTNLVNNKIYIGQDKNNNPDYYGSGIILKEAINKYGKENFKKEILEVCYSLEELNEKEIFWIKEYNSTDRNKGYNITIGGDGGDTYTFNKEEKKKLIIEKRKKTMLERYGGAVNKGKPMSEEQKEKLSISKSGQKYPNRKKYYPTKEHKQKIKEAHDKRVENMTYEERLEIAKYGIKANKGKRRSKETRDKLSKALKGNENAKSK